MHNKTQARNSVCLIYSLEYPIFGFAQLNMPTSHFNLLQKKILAGTESVP